MPNTAKNAILKAKIEGVIYEIMVKTGAENVYVDGTTTLSAKLSEIIADLALKATKTELNDGLTLKAEKAHTHAQADVTGLANALSARPTTEAMNTAINTAISNLIDGAPETYDTLKEIAAYIASDKTAMEALNAAIGNKADKTAFETVKKTVDALGALASKNKVAETDLTDELKEKVNAAAEGNHSHANKALLDTYDQTNANIKAAIAAKHTHTNKATLDKISEDNLTAWSGKSKIYYSATEPAALAEGDLWVHLQ